MDYTKTCTCALVAASDFNDTEFRRRAIDAQTYDFIIAVDGGFTHVSALGVTADVVLGDFDSLGFVPEHEHLEVHPVAKDASDLALALRRAGEHGATHVDVYGALGQRPDHTFATYQALYSAARHGLAVRAFGVDSGVVVLTSEGTSAITLPAIADETFSVFALTNECHGVTIQNFRYELIDGDLTNDTPLGLSNVTLGVSGTIAVKDGALLVFLPQVLMAEL